MFPPSLKFVLTACALGCLALSGQTTTTSATRQFTFPPAGLGSTETARINVVNTATVSSSSSTTIACVVSLSFLNATGATIGSATSVTLATGQIGTASLPATQAGISGVRGAIRGEITYTESSTNRCALTYSFETFDTSSGATHLFVAGSGGFSGPGR